MKHTSVDLRCSGLLYSQYLFLASRANKGKSRFPVGMTKKGKEGLKKGPRDLECALLAEHGWHTDGRPPRKAVST